MSILSYLFWNSKIEDLADRVAEVHARSEERREEERASVQDQLDALRSDLEELALFARTTATLLIERGIVTDQQFLDRMMEIDRADGAEDGRIGPT